jgi:hypothetical protein
METNNKIIKYAKDNTSQCGEDGVIEEVLKRLNITKGAVLDIGASDGKWFSNTFSLLQRGFDVYAIERSDNAQKMFELQKEYPTLHPVQVGVERDKDSENHINKILDRLGVPQEIEFMSLDIDSIDPWVLEDLDRKPKLFCVEVEPRYFPTDMKWHNPDGDRKTNPPQNLTGFWPFYEIAKKKGYFLIGQTGQNPFFLRNDLLKDLDMPEVTEVEELTNYNPHYLNEKDKLRWKEYK